MSGKEIFLQKNNSKLTVSWESRLLRNILVCQTLVQKLLKILQLVWASCCTLNVKILKAHDLFPWPGVLRNWWGRIWLTQKRAMAICPQDMLQVKQGVPYLSTRSCHKWWAKCLAAPSHAQHMNCDVTVEEPLFWKGANTVSQIVLVQFVWQ